jgi:hypothetical protein
LLILPTEEREATTESRFSAQEGGATREDSCYQRINSVWVQRRLLLREAKAELETVLHDTGSRALTDRSPLLETGKE